MGKPVPPEDLVIPPQDGKICGTICLCQMIAVLSLVSLVYLTVAVYMPTLRAFESGISETPAMCTTTRNVMKDTCDWGTCGEWCLSKTSGACSQVYVSLRNNGSDLLFINCTNSANKTCYGIDQENAKKYKCAADECKNLTGTFNCSRGACINITDAFACEFKQTDPPMKCSGRRGKITCMEIHGLQTCNRGSCERIQTPYNCDRRCTGIPTRNMNVIVLSGDQAYLSQCDKAIDVDSNQEVWNREKNNGTVMVSCYSVTNSTKGVEATDCINGSLLTHNLSDFSSFTYLIHLSVTNNQLLDPSKMVAPPEMDLIIANESRLLINLEGCVNSLKDECKEFLRSYGRDGTDHNARARFPCFYAEKNFIPEEPVETKFVVARFDLDGTYKEFLVAFLLPSILCVVSCFTLVLCQRTVVVGDDAKMRFKCVEGAQIITADKNGSGSLTGGSAL